MASSVFKPSRILAVLIVLAAGGWIASGALSQNSENAEAEVAEEHEAEAPRYWADMLVVYQTSSKDRVRDLQKRLMDYIGNSNKLQRKLANALDTAKAPSTDPPYFLYILRAFDEQKVLD